MHRQSLHHTAALCCISLLSVAAWFTESREAVCQQRPAIGSAITVALVDGREVSGEVARESDERMLWLARSEPGLAMTSGFVWKRVARWSGLGPAIGPSKEWIEEQPLLAKTKTVEDVPPPATSVTLSVNPSQGRVDSLRAFAELAFWDNDALPDGLLVYVSPLNARGELVAVRGEVELTLYGMFHPRDESSRSAGAPAFPELERIGWQVRPSDFSQGPAVYRLPFSKTQPDTDLNLAAIGLLHVRLGVNGQGVWETSVADICTRPVSRFRDQLQHATQRRYLPNE
jgi:hypothetical protein